MRGTGRDARSVGMKVPRRITVMMDAACIEADDPDFVAQHGEPTTEFHVVSTLRDLGYEVSILGVHDDAGAVVDGLRKQSPDLVFNLTEEFRGDRRQDRNLAALLELLGVPFTGSGALGLSLCRNKSLCKQLLNLHHIRVPGFVVIPARKFLRLPADLNYPLVVKPVYEDGSVGISNASRVMTPAALAERARLVHERWRQPAIAEEYIEGRELYVTVLGNERRRVLPPREFFRDPDNGDGPLMATYRVKWDDAYQEKWNIRFGFAMLDEALTVKLNRICKRTCRILQVHDYARIDLRITPGGRIYILEVNPNPDIAYGEEVAESAERAGIAYPALLQKIVRMAMRRHAE